MPIEIKIPLLEIFLMLKSLSVYLTGCFLNFENKNNGRTTIKTTCVRKVKT